jgi:predicted ABC-type ATPase
LQDTIDPNHSDMEAGRRVLLLAEELIASRQSFTVETTLSGNTYLRMVSRAKVAGFSIMVIFVGTSSVEINIERVKARVEKVGHDVSEEVQRRRYPRTLKNMKRLLPQADLAVVLDNSNESGYVLLAFGARGDLHWNEPVPQWAAPLRD